MLLDWNNLKASSDACWSTLCLSEKLYYDVLDNDNDLDYVDVYYDVYVTNKGYKLKSFLKKNFACLRRSRLSRTPLLELMIGICRGST